MGQIPGLAPGEGWISERFLSREGSGEAISLIPGAHEASLEGPEREIGWQTKYAT